MTFTENIIKSNDVKRAMNIPLPVVALESTVLTHVLPRPQNLGLARDMERAVREEGATPATIGFLDGYLHVGMTDAELERLSNEKEPYKVGPRDFARVITNEACGGTTVAGTMLACKHAGIKVFATGGIGGVHRGKSPFDISADLQALANIPMIVVCAGAKAILDLPATLEYLETMSVPVIGFNTDEFPAFYSRDSGLDAADGSGRRTFGKPIGPGVHPRLRSRSASTGTRTTVRGRGSRAAAIGSAGGRPGSSRRSRGRGGDGNPIARAPRRCRPVHRNGRSRLLQL